MSTHSINYVLQKFSFPTNDGQGNEKTINSLNYESDGKHVIKIDVTGNEYDDKEELVPRQNVDDSINYSLQQFTILENDGQSNEKIIDSLNYKTVRKNDSLKGTMVNRSNTESELDIIQTPNHVVAPYLKEPTKITTLGPRRCLKSDFLFRNPLSQILSSKAVPILHFQLDIE